MKKAKGRVCDLGKGNSGVWSDEEDRRSKDEGWALFTVERDGIEFLEIEKLDEDERERFGSDDEALSFVLNQAALGIRHCLKAILLHNCPTSFSVFVPERCDPEKRRGGRPSQ